MAQRAPRPVDQALLAVLKWQTLLPQPQRIDLAVTTQAAPKAICIGQTTSSQLVATVPVKDIGYIWGYGEPGNITSPGPTLVATEGQPAWIEWHNQLPRNARGQTHWPFAEPAMDLQAAGSTMHRYATGHAVVHMHGARVPWVSDGYPMRIPTGPRNPTGERTVMKPGESQVREYPNQQPGGATLWYHDHAMDMTARNVYAGLAGFYLLRHPLEAAAKQIPTDRAFERELVLQDKSFTTDAGPAALGLLYGDAAFLEARWRYLHNAGGLSADARRAGIRAAQYDPSPEFKGTAMLVNGVLWPKLPVERRTYRFRVLNGSQSRMYVLRVSPELPPDPVTGLVTADVTKLTPPMPIWQLGGDGGFFSAAVELRGRLVAAPPGSGRLWQPRSTADFLVLAPGERADVLIDFSQCAPRSNLYLTNHAIDDGSVAAQRMFGSVGWGNGGDGAAGSDLEALLQFNVSDTQSTALDLDGLKADLAAMSKPLPDRVPAKLLRSRAYVVNEFPVAVQPSQRPPQWPQTWKAITFQPDLTSPNAAGYLWAGRPPAALAGAIPSGGPDLAGEPRAKLGTEELWAFVNVSPDTHPLHLHLVQLRLHARQDLPLDALGMPIVPLTLPATPAADTGIDLNEQGWKDTVRANPGQITWLWVRFDAALPGDPTDYRGHFVWHCHLLEHEDMGMMRPLEVV